MFEFKFTADGGILEKDGVRIQLTQDECRIIVDAERYYWCEMDVLMYFDENYPEHSDKIRKDENKSLLESIVDDYFDERKEADGGESHLAWYECRSLAIERHWDEIQKLLKGMN